MFIVDFDDTIFDTASFKTLRRNAVANCGVPAEVFDESYFQVSTEGGYANDSHAQAIAARGYAYTDVLAALETTTTPEALRSLVLPGAHEFLARLKSGGGSLVLLTYCNPSFQKRKIAGAELEAYFDHLILTPDSKIDALAKIKDELAGSWFINDKIKETIDILAAYPGLRGVLKVVPGSNEAEYMQSGLPAFNDLHAIANYVVQ